jgi:beta-phosphoglucomutase-like phosphatase (HAD superfamily)
MTRAIELVIFDCHGVLVDSERLAVRSEVTNGKPTPDLFLHAAQQMGVDPAACAVVEDSR